MCVGKAGCAKCALAEIFKNAKRGLFLFSSLSVVSVVVQLQCWSSRVSPVVKSVCKTICLLLLVIVNVSVVFFACAPTVWVLPKRSEEHTSELQSRGHLVCRLLLEK